MELIQCKAVLAAAEMGSLSAAAIKLDYTQSGITRMLNSVENEVGFPLFVRTKKGVQLTENGKEMLPLFRKIVQAHKNADELSAEICGMVKGSLIIGCYYTISSMIMPEILGRFCSAYPGVNVRMQEGGNLEMARWIQERSVDCCFGANLGMNDYDWIPVLEDELVAWLPKNHPLAGENAYPVSRLEKDPFIYILPNSDTEQDRLLSAYHLHPTVRFTTRDGFTAFRLVENGLGVSFNQRMHSKNWKGAVVIKPFEPAQFIQLGITVPSLKEASPAVKKFIEYVKHS